MGNNNQKQLYSQHQKHLHLSQKHQSYYQPYYYNSNDTIKTKEELELQEQKEYIYKYILGYFSDITFTKVRNDRLNEKSYSIYYAKLECLVCTEMRYLIAIIPYDMTINGNREKLSNLKWVSFQTILFSKDPEFYIKEFSSYPGKESLIKLDLRAEHYSVNDNEFTKSIIEIEERKDDRSIYIARKYPILKIELFNSKNGNKNEYSDKSTIASALLSFNCTLSFII